MSSQSIFRATGRSLALLALPLLGGCGMQVLAPAGDVARQQAHILAVSTVLMLLIIVPVMALTIFFAWRYRASNDAVEHRPDWDHSTTLELVIWSAPLLIIIMLGAITWISTHTLDPYRRLDRLAPGKAVPAGAKPLEIDVVALDWKWLFIYPEQGIATVNQLALPVGREVRFRITASTVMNSFYVPMLAGQIYAMPGMETKLHAVLNRDGTFEGFSANYSGAGFSGMHFPVKGLDDAGFARWVERMRAGGARLDAAAYRTLAKPSENVPPMNWAAVDPKLFGRIVETCVEPGASCAGAGMHGHAGSGAFPGVSPTPVNDTKTRPPGEPEGALLRSGEEKGSSPRPGTPADVAQPNSHH